MTDLHKTVRTYYLTTLYIAVVTTMILILTVVDMWSD